MDVDDHVGTGSCSYDLDYDTSDLIRPYLFRYVVQ